MEKDYLTLQDASVLLGKSIQTIRRMIKKGELNAQRIRTPQGFHYVIKREALGIQMLYNSPIQNDYFDDVEEEKKVLTNQSAILTNQTEKKVLEKADFDDIDKIESDRGLDVIVQNSDAQIGNDINSPGDEMPVGKETLLKIIEAQHAEKLFLMQILDRLQRELDREIRKPRSFFAYLIDWLL